MSEKKSGEDTVAGRGDVKTLNEGHKCVRPKIQVCKPYVVSIVQVSVPFFENLV